MLDDSTALLPAWPLLSAFLLASLLLAVTPGPVVIYIVVRSLAQGRRSGLVSVAGVALGNLGNAGAASLGLAALFAVSAAAFALVRYAGAAYLVYLGVHMLRDARREIAQRTPEAIPLRRVFRDSFVVALLNPKTTLFFAAFLPQFLDRGRPAMLPSLMLGGLFVGIAALTDGAYALAAGTVAGMLRERRGLQRGGRYLGGLSFIGLGVFAAASGIDRTK
jgi:threonine/homoserine/homoserine lactone efflux protein